MKVSMLRMTCFILLLIPIQAHAGALPVNGMLGIDFGSTAPAASTNFNAFDIDTIDGQTVSLPTGSLIDTNGSALASVGFSLTNNTGQDTTRANVTNGAEGDGTAITNSTLYEDSYISNNQGAAPLDPIGTANIVVTISGLDDSLTYDLVGGFDNNNGNFDAEWSADGQAITTDPAGAAGAGYASFTGLSTDGSGNLAITVTRTNLHVTLGALQLTAVPEPGSTSLLLFGIVGVALLRRRK